MSLSFRRLQTQTLKPVLTLVLASILLTGCLKSNILVKLKADGSGTILVTRQFSKQAVSLVERMQQMGGNAGGAIDNPFYDEDALKDEATKYGDDITFVRAKKFDRNGTRGSMALYSFSDINKVSFGIEALNPPDKGMVGGAMRGRMGKRGNRQPADNKDNIFSFKLVKGPRNKLTITMPPYPKDKGGDHPVQKSPTKGKTPVDPQLAMLLMVGGFGRVATQEEAIQKIFKGMAMSLVIEIDASNIKTDASHSYKTNKGKRRIVLLEMNMDAIMATEKGRALMDPEAMQGGADSQARLFSALKDVPGMKMETQERVTVTF